MTDQILPRGSKRRVAANIMVKPFFNTIIRLMYIKVFGKQLFINQYTKKIPLISRLIEKVESISMLAHSKKEIEADYKKWFKKNFPNNTELKKQKNDQKNLKKRPLISILVPTYNTNHQHLRECIESVINQSYDNWQLCIADDASKDKSVKDIISEYAEKDRRIEFVFRDKNGHICKASNSALGIAKGKYIALLDHDDVLWPNALFEVVELINQKDNPDFVYTDEDKIDAKSENHCEAFFKPDWSYDFLRSINYITHFAILKKELVDKIGGFRPGYEGAQDWDLFLRASRVAKNIYHIPEVLYSWRKSPTSTAEQASAKNYAYVSQKKALEDDIKARRLSGNVDWQIPLFMWKIKYDLKKETLVSIIIPTKNQHDYIKRCLDSIYKKTTYKNIEVVIVDTGSTDKSVWTLYDEFKDKIPDTKVIKWDKPFNFSSVCNFGADNSNGEYYVFLNNDTEIISPDWIENMLGYAQQNDIGAVGCKLYYPDRKLQHAGIILGVGGRNGTPGIAGHFFPGFMDEPPQTPHLPLYTGGARNFTAVTAACIMVSKEKFYDVKGFDPKFKIAFNDVDFCLKLYSKNLRNIYLPNVALYHYESVSIGKPGEKQRDTKIFAQEISLMLKKWDYLIKSDPFYHPEFRRDIASTRLKIK